MSQEYRNIHVTINIVTGTMMHVIWRQEQSKHSYRWIHVMVIWNNCVQGIHVMASNATVFPCISGIITWNNSVQCNNICIAVIQVYGMTVSTVISVYKKHNVQYTGVSSVLDDTSTNYNNVSVPMILVHNKIVIWCSKIFM